ncbi:hypothetical protein FGO68_gene5087 [Halteria grandinella]|uniref:Uncharacterized protein n=1 Tax=Halteria grandinella TaxID=5974 RepID=A0A8J8NZ61_HALGN|nr:hypothetical protein FGO68_gene5087 [Halteria grandinella]
MQIKLNLIISLILIEVLIIFKKLKCSPLPSNRRPSSRWTTPRASWTSASSAACATTWASVSRASSCTAGTRCALAASLPCTTTTASRERPHPLEDQLRLRRSRWSRPRRRRGFPAGEAVPGAPRASEALLLLEPPDSLLPRVHPAAPLGRRVLRGRPVRDTEDEEAAEGEHHQKC